MAIDKAKLTAYIEELGLGDAARTAVLAELEADESKANKFVGQRLRHDDYTKKTQELSTTKQTLEQQVAQQLSGYAQELTTANEKIANIAKDLENERISKSTAEARLMKVKTTYGLSDEDIPTVQQMQQQPPTAAAPAIDKAALMEELRQTLLKEFRTDLQAMPGVTATQFDIAAQHQELFGKRMSKDEMSALTEIAQKNRTNLQTAWEMTHDVPKVRTSKLVETEIANARQKWEDERRAAADAAALSSVTSQRDQPSFTNASSVLGRKYETHVDPTTPSDPARAVQPSSPVPTQTGQRLSGAERAAAAWITKAQNGLIGKPMAAKTA